MRNPLSVFWEMNRNHKPGSTGHPPLIRVLRNSRHPLILVVLHTGLFLWLFPRLDLPVLDDANYFGHGVLFAKSGRPLYGDLYPLQTYFAAGLYHLLYSNGWAYAVYAWFSQLTFLLGSYAFIQAFTRKAGWALPATGLIAVAVSYPFNLNVQLFPAGVLLSLLAWMEFKKTIDLWFALAVMGIAYLLRAEYSLIAAGFSLRGLYKQARCHSFLRLFLPDYSSLAAAALALAAAWPVVSWGTWTGHFNHVFETQFTRYAQENGLCEPAGISPSIPPSEAMDAFFPPRQRKMAFLAGWCPVISTASANPGLFLDFLARQASPFLRGDFSFSESQALSSFLSLFVLISLFILLGMVLHGRQWDYRSHLYLSAVFAAGALPVLCGTPTRHHLLPAIVWFVGVIPSLWLTASPHARLFLYGLITIAVFNQAPHWREAYQRLHGDRNRQRADFVLAAARRGSLDNISLAEPYPIFSVAFCRPVGTSSDYHAAWDDTGHFRSNDGTGAEIQYVLLEEYPPGVSGPSAEALLPILRHNGILVTEEGPFALWKVDPIRVFVTDDIHQEKDLCLGTDIDLPDKRQLVIRWDLPGHAFTDFHIWIKVDGGEEQYLGRTASGEAKRFVWEERSGRPAEEALRHENEPELAEAFVSGPEPDHRYEFILYGIPPSVNPEQPQAPKPQPFYTKGPLEFREAP